MNEQPICVPKIAMLEEYVGQITKLNDENFDIITNINRKLSRIHNQQEPCIKQDLGTLKEKQPETILEYLDVQYKRSVIIQKELEHIFNQLCNLV